jgi:hypothetical protein
MLANRISIKGVRMKRQARPLASRRRRRQVVPQILPGDSIVREPTWGRVKTTPH